ncbi:hypothetical protein ACFYWN_00395 [Streptomyces sp. NPDC002917]|uniref:hypothetical protein n=1 Tax=Streptomyces sp. NPDC002917 TaxID=3364671 RepID=UPI0036BA5A4F
MNSMAGEWWENVNVWAIVVSAVVALLVGWLGAWAAFRSANPKLRLNWWLRVNSPLIPPSYATSSITVNAAGVQLAEPRIVEFELTNAGRKDITSAMFHNNETIVIDLGVPIITLLASESRPDGAPPSLAFPPAKPSQFEIEPSHIARGQSVAFRLLADGPEAKARITRKPLVDVRVEEAAPGATARTLAEVAVEAVALVLSRR